MKMLNTHFLDQNLTMAEYLRDHDFDLVINTLHTTETLLAGALPDVPTMTHISMAPSIMASVMMNIPLISSAGYMIMGP